MTRRIIAATTALVALACLTATGALAGSPGPLPLQGAHFDGRSPDTKDAAAATRSPRTTAALSPATVDGRSPDTRDAAAAAHSGLAPVIVADASGFDWTDAGIGAAAGFGLAAMLASGLALVRGRQHVIAPS